MTVHVRCIKPTRWCSLRRPGAVDFGYPKQGKLKGGDPNFEVMKDALDHIATGSGVFVEGKAIHTQPCREHAHEVKQY
jgi:hypothetical protein